MATDCEFYVTKSEQNPAMAIVLRNIFIEKQADRTVERHVSPQMKPERAGLLGDVLVCVIDIWFDPSIQEARRHTGWQ